MPIERALFLKGTAAAFFTGGLDIWSAPGAVAPATIRVLITGDRGSELPSLADGDIFYWSGRRWRGSPATIAMPGGRSGIVATVGIDDYLYGVLPIETSPGWPPQTLAAQAIVARTFALARRTLGRPYDVAVSQADQRFGGIEAEFPGTNAAVDATRGSILTYDGGNAAVFYAACCGGHTADAAEIWGHAALPYLRGVADPYCVAAPDYRWQREVPLGRAQAALAAHVQGPISGFALGPAGSGGRPLTVDVFAGTERTTLPAPEFRALLGADVVRSTWIQTLALQGSSVLVAGAGRGHGVGFCQWGARAMGAVGAAAADMLAFYFPGTRIAPIDAGGH